MSDELNVADVLEDWLNANSARLSGRFKIERVADWRLGAQQSIALDLVHDKVLGRITAWPKCLADVDWPFADAEALDAETGQQLFSCSFEELSPALLDRWFAALETHANS